MDPQKQTSDSDVMTTTRDELEPSATIEKTTQLMDRYQQIQCCDQHHQQISCGAQLMEKQKVDDQVQRIGRSVKNIRQKVKRQQNAKEIAWSDLKLIVGCSIQLPDNLTYARLKTENILQIIISCQDTHNFTQTLQKQQQPMIVSGSQNQITKLNQAISDFGLQYTNVNNQLMIQPYSKQTANAISRQLKYIFENRNLKTIKKTNKSVNISVNDLCFINNIKSQLRIHSQKGIKTQTKSIYRV